MSEAKRRIRYLFTGIVQGVGFRPFIYRFATKHRLGGFV
jgi:hydrogenase maturation protein HypF